MMDMYGTVTAGRPPLSLKPMITILFVVAPKPYAPRPEVYWPRLALGFA